MIMLSEAKLMMVMLDNKNFDNDNLYYDHCCACTLCTGCCCKQGWPIITQSSLIPHDDTQGDTKRWASILTLLNINNNPKGGHDKYTF